jgi:hypothetical protein
MNDVRQERHQPAEAAAPPADLKALGDRLVGTWKVSGEAEGETSWEWMDGGFFLIQRGWTRREGVEQTYIQIIGHDRMPGSEPADAISGPLYTNHGDTLAYVCESEGDTMTIWMGEKGSPAVYRHLQHRRQHDRRRLGMARRRLQGDVDPRPHVAHCRRDALVTRLRHHRSLGGALV